jgi:hypothetical protein
MSRQSPNSVQEGSKKQRDNCQSSKTIQSFKDKSKIPDLTDLEDEDDTEGTFGLKGPKDFNRVLGCGG